MLELFRHKFQDPISGHKIPYLEFYNEARAFQIPLGKTKPEAMPGKHDDIIMGEAIGAAVSALMPDPEVIVKQTIHKPGTVGYEVQKRINRHRNRTPAGMRNF